MHVRLQVTGLGYLDKIIHIPFCMPMIPEANRLELLRSLLHGNDDSCSVTLARLKDFEVIVDHAKLFITLSPVVLQGYVLVINV